MSMGIYICPWVFINVHGYLYMSMGIYICPWVFINVHGYLKMLVGIYQSEGIYQKVMILFKVWFCYITVIVT